MMKARGVVKEEAPLVVVVWMAAGFESSEMTKLQLILSAFEKARKTPPGHGSKINLIVPLSPMGKHWVKSAILWVTEKVMNFLPSNDLLLYPMGD